MKKIIIATSNPHKLTEMSAINTFPEIVFDTVKGEFNPDENGNTFLENAVIKAKEGAKVSGEYCLADDSGLCVDYLNGLPGLKSARYAETREKRIQKLLKELDGVEKEKRTAHFICTMALVSPSGDVLHTTEGRVSGIIIEELKGLNGFGYDPVFYIPEYKQTMAEMSEEEKNRISHRANALRPMLKWINENL